MIRGKLRTARLAVAAVAAAALLAIPAQAGAATDGARTGAVETVAVRGGIEARPQVAAAPGRSVRLARAGRWRITKRRGGRR